MLVRDLETAQLLGLGHVSNEDAILVRLISLGESLSSIQREPRAT